jgi:thiamine phosphate synthase YjbQ (UPF0047 family)
VIAGAGASDGVVSVFVRGSTAAITTMENEPGRRHYEHNVRNHDDNAHSHLRGIAG